MIRVLWDGLDDFKRGLVGLPAELVAAGAPLARAAAGRAAAEIRAAYPRGKTGQLAGGVETLEQKIGPYGITVSVVNTTWYSVVFEKSKQKKRYTGRRGNPRMYRGIFKRRPIFGPIVAKHKIALGAELVALMRAAGLIVHAA